MNIKKVLMGGGIATAMALVAFAGIQIAAAALTFNGTSITGDSNSVIDATGTISIGANSATGITIGQLGQTVLFPGNISSTNLFTGNATTTNLSITGLGTSGSPCLTVNAAGNVATTTCGSAGTNYWSTTSTGIYYNGSVAAGANVSAGQPCSGIFSGAICANSLEGPSSGTANVGGYYVTAGDSLCVVYNLTTAQSYPTIAISTTPFTTYSSALVNTCVDGEALTGLISDYPIHVAPYAPATTGQPAILSISILGNDIANICPSGCTYTEASYEALFTSYINRATAAGFQIEFLLQWPQDGRTTTQENIVRNDINAWFQANPSVSWIINALGFMTCTTTCATNSTYYQSDGVHETAYASGLIAGLIQTLHASSWVPTQNLTASIIINQNLSTTLGFHTPTGFFTAGQFNTTNGFVPANGIDALAAKKPWYIYDTIPTGGGIMGINPSGFQEQLFTLSSGTIAFGAMSNSLVFSPWDTVNSLGLSNFGIIGDDGQSMGIQAGSGNNQELFTSTSTGKVSLGYTTGGVFTPWLTASASGVTVPLFTPASVPNAALANSSTQVNGQTCVLGGSCTIAASNTAVNTPVWLQYLGDGSSGANINASGNMTGEYYYTNFTVPYGNTVTVNYPSGLIIHATGACTIAGTIEANGATAGAAGSPGAASSGGGGSGGGASAGTTGGSYYSTTDGAQTGGGTAGAASGGNGGNGASGVPYKRIFLASGWGQDGQWASGGMGKQGANSGGSAGNGGAGVMLMCGSITGTDGTNIGIIDASGQTGGNAAANSTGAGSGGGGGVVVLSSQTAVTTWPTINTPGGAGGTCGSFTTCGTGGSGSAGWSAEFQGW